MRSRRAGTADAPPAKSAYPTALAMLARRELSSSQIKQRLARRGFEPDVIEATITRLTDERAIDDRRVAEAIARSQIQVKRRGRRRIEQEMARKGIGAGTIRTVLDDVLSDVDQDALIDAALAKRLRDGRSIADEREYARLYRYLVAQGFDSDRTRRVLSARRQSR